MRTVRKLSLLPSDEAEDARSLIRLIGETYLHGPTSQLVIVLDNHFEQHGRGKRRTTRRSRRYVVRPASSPPARAFLAEPTDLTRASTSGGIRLRIASRDGSQSP